MKLKINSTKRLRKGALFHYAPFILHCLFPEIIQRAYNYSTVYRRKNLDSTLGNFKHIYEEVLVNESLEVSAEEFDKIEAPIIDSEFRREYLSKNYFDTFTDWIFRRYSIKNNEYDSAYPEVLLVKRAEHVDLIADKELKAQLPKPPKDAQLRNIDGDQLIGQSKEVLDYHFFVTNGRDRREMDRIDDVEQYLQQRYGNRFLAVCFETLPFVEQVKYYNNARLIICVHGGCQINQIFCKPDTRIIEVEANGKKFEMFDNISRIQNLDHRKCTENQYDKIIEFLKNNAI